MLSSLFGLLGLFSQRIIITLGKQRIIALQVSFNVNTVTVRHQYINHAETLPQPGPSVHSVGLCNCPVSFTRSF